MKNVINEKDRKPGVPLHAPGRGGDKQHPETPPKKDTQ